MADLQSTLEALYGGNSDLGGGPGPGDARALAQLILGGGRASVGGRDLLGAGTPEASGPALPGADRLGPTTGTPGTIDPNNPVRVQGVDQAASDAATAAWKPTPEFERVMTNANAIAASLAPKRDKAAAAASDPSLGNITLLANPYGRGSYNPNDPKQVEAVQAQKVQADKLDASKQLLSSEVFKLLPADVQKALTTQTLEGAGVLPTKASQVKAEAQAKAEGERAGGKGVKLVVPESVRKSIGTDSFDVEMSRAIEAGQIADTPTILALQRQHDKKEKDIRVESVDRRLLSGLRNSEETLKGILDSYETTPAFKSGKLSDTLKTALSTNAKATTLLEFNPIDPSGLSPEEVDFSTKYNAMMAGLRDFSGDPRFSDRDSVLTLKAIGDPLSGPKVFPQQVRATIDRLNRKRKISIEDMKSSGRDVSQFESKVPAEATKAATTQSSGTLPNGKRFRTVNGKIQVEE